MIYFYYKCLQIIEKEFSFISTVRASREAVSEILKWGNLVLNHAADLKYSSLYSNPHRSSYDDAMMLTELIIGSKGVYLSYLVHHILLWYCLCTQLSIKVRDNLIHAPCILLNIPYWLCYKNNHSFNNNFSFHFYAFLKKFIISQKLGIYWNIYIWYRVRRSNLPLLLYLIVDKHSIRSKYGTPNMKDILLCF